MRHIAQFKVFTLGNFSSSAHRLSVLQHVMRLDEDEINASIFSIKSRIWQGRLDSNQRMAGSKPAALPLGDAPVVTTD